MTWYVPAPSGTDLAPPGDTRALGCDQATLDRPLLPQDGWSDDAHAAGPTISSLHALLEEAAVLEIADRASWSRLADAAAPVIDGLIARGAVPDHLAVRAGEPPVVVRRTIAAAWGHATDARRSRSLGRPREQGGRRTAAGSSPVS